MNVLKKEFKTNDGKITLVFDYKEDEVIDDLSLKTLEKSLCSVTDYKMIKLINVIRASLHNYTETYLSIKVELDNYRVEVVFEDKCLKIYNKKEEISPDCDIESKYKDKSYFNSRITGPGIDKVMMDNKVIEGKQEALYLQNFYNEMLINEITDIKEMIKDLTSPITLLGYYKFFYSSEADMTDENSKEKLQIMTYILKYFGLLDSLYTFEIDQFGYEFFGRDFEAAFLPKSPEISSDHELLQYIKDINHNGLEIQNKEKIISIGNLIGEVTGFDIKKLRELAIILYINSYKVLAENNEREHERKSELENSASMQKALSVKLSSDQVANTNKLISELNSKFKK